MIKELIPKKLYKRIGRYVMTRTPIEIADLAFVFGSRDGVEEFADEIVRYWKRGFFPWIVIAGGSTQGIPKPESDVLREKLMERGRKDFLPVEPPPQADLSFLFLRGAPRFS